MIATIEKGKAAGAVKAPPSKSMAHRMLIGGAFSKESIIKGVSFSRDIKATLGGLKALGADVDVKGDEVRVGGLCSAKKIKGADVFCDESGSTLRFLIPTALLSENEVTFVGSERLFERPLSVYEDICRERELQFLPYEKGLKVRGPLTGGDFHVPGNISSQFISGLLFALPFTEKGGTIYIEGKLESRSYIDLTLWTLKKFGIKTAFDGNIIKIPGQQQYESVEGFVEGDCSNAAFFEALNYVGNGSRVIIEGIDKNTLQGDRVYKELIKSLLEKNCLIDITDCPDLAPVLFAVAGANNGGKFTGTRRLRLKESDRGEAMKAELSKFGIEMSIEENSITVFRPHSGGLKTPTEILCGHNDHRIVMALAVLCTLTGGRISEEEAVEKSFPDFFKSLKSVGISAEVTE